MNNREQELYDMIRDIQEKVAVLSTELKRDHAHLSEKVDNHVTRFNKFKDEMEAQFGAISSGFMQLASKEETKKEVSATRLVLIIGGSTVLATLISGVLAVIYKQWIGG